MEIPTIKKWLHENGRDREWLAQYCRVSKATVDGWLSVGRPIPGPALKLIEGLISSALPSSGELDFDLVMRLDRARVQAGYSTLEEFIRDTLETKAEEFLDDSKQPNS